MHGQIWDDSIRPMSGNMSANVRDIFSRLFGCTLEMKWKVCDG